MGICDTKMVADQCFQEIRVIFLRKFKKSVNAGWKIYGKNSRPGVQFER